MTSYHYWEGVQHELLTDKEIAESDQRAQRLIGQINASRLAEICQRRTRRSRWASRWRRSWLSGG